MKCGWLFLLLPLLLPAVCMADIFVDQVGYLPSAPKIVLVSTPADSFDVVSEPAGEVVFRGTLSLSRLNDPASGFTLYKGDFSVLDTPGSYRVIVRADSSAAFVVADSVYTAVLHKTLKGFYFQRCGMELHPSHAGVYAHGRCHIGDGFFHASTDTSGFSLARGGWHDAGDFGKYVVNAGITVGTLLLAYEAFRDRLSFDDLGIPESGNGVPDILDEVRYELQWMLLMQRPDGAVYFKLTREQFSGFVMPDQDSGVRYIYQVSSTATADFAAVMARAARVYEDFDQTFATGCLEAAEKAWIFLQGNSTVLPSGGFRNPAGTNTGEYGDTQDADERLWAAAELFRTTGNVDYQNMFLFQLGETDFFAAVPSWQNVKAMAMLTYLNTSVTAAPDAARESILAGLIDFSEDAVRRARDSGFHVLLEPGEYYWGSNSLALNKALLLIFAYRDAAKFEYFAAALDQLHYVLGVNAHNMSFVTGVGNRSVQSPHHRPSIADGVDAPVPGLLAGGPNEYLQDPVLASRFDAATPPALAYADDRNSFASNEIAINWNAALAFVSAFFSAASFPTEIRQYHWPTVPIDQLFGNYPNPFNPFTIISFQLHHGGFTSLKVYDLLGRERITLVHETLDAGVYRIPWDASDYAGGVYFYELVSGGRRTTAKMLLLK